MTVDLTRRSSWLALEAARDRLCKRRTIELFKADPHRAAHFSIEAAGLFLDWSKNKIDRDAMAALVALAKEVDVRGAIERMAAGDHINATEDRAVLHIALRDLSGRRFQVDGVAVGSLIAAANAKMRDFANSFEKGALAGFSGMPLDTVVNIGIGGSDLGPLMASQALRPYWLEGKRVHFVSNVDGQHLDDVLTGLDPAKTLFVIASKTFTTQETMMNAESARAWLLANGAEMNDIALHFAAVSTNEPAVQKFGIAADRMFEFWDWVGGRFSLWSSIGLSIALQCGWTNFEALRVGAGKMDEHFLSAPLDRNMPAILALTALWNRNFMGASAHAVLPYDQHLSRLPAYLQQLEMESNGKSTTVSGDPVSVSTCPIVFGEPGTNGQHAFYQLLHQGADLVACDFIAAALSSSALPGHQEMLIANFLAQTEALMIGKDMLAARAELKASGATDAEQSRLAPHKVFPGDRPTNSILMERLTPHTLGALIALYEHKVFCLGALWGVNSFDQWGVELGKSLAKAILPSVAHLGEARPVPVGHDGSTTSLIEWINKRRAEARN